MKGAAAGGRRLHAAGAAHPFHAFAHDGKADAGAGITRPLQPLKDAEDFFPELRGDAYAVVLQPKANPAPAVLRPKADGWLHARRDELQRIA